MFRVLRGHYHNSRRYKHEPPCGPPPDAEPPPSRQPNLAAPAARPGVHVETVEHFLFLCEKLEPIRPKGLIAHSEGEKREVAYDRRKVMFSRALPDFATTACRALGWRHPQQLPQSQREWDERRTTGRKTSTRSPDDLGEAANSASGREEAMRGGLVEVEGTMQSARGRGGLGGRERPTVSWGTVLNTYEFPCAEAAHPASTEGDVDRDVREDVMPGAAAEPPPPEAPPGPAVTRGASDTADRMAANPPAGGERGARVGKRERDSEDGGEKRCSEGQQKNIPPEGDKKR